MYRWYNRLVRQTETTNNEEREMFESMKPGDQLTFQYLEKTTKLECNESLKDWYREVSYEVKNYSGTILEIRDTREKPVKWRTTAYQPNIERSRYLLTVRLDNRKIHSFYDGRMINVTHTPAVVPCVADWKSTDFGFVTDKDLTIKEKLNILGGMRPDYTVRSELNLSSPPQAKKVGIVESLLKMLRLRV